MVKFKFRKEKIVWTILAYTSLSFFALIYLFPFLRSIPVSFMNWSQVRDIPPTWIPNPFTFENYEALIGLKRFVRWTFNSILFSAIVVAGNCIFATMAGYAFARMEFPGKDVLFSALLALMMVPGFILLVPNYIIMYQLGLMDNIIGLGIMGMIGVSSIFLIRQYFITFSKDIFEAAKLDGCSHLQIVYYIAFPLAKPAIGAIAVYSFLGSWNAFIGPLIFLRSPDNYTLPLGLIFAFDRGWYIEYTPIIAGTLLISLPTIILFIALNKYLIKGIVITSGKG